MRRIIQAAALAALLTAAPAWADAMDFWTCDGFKAPAKGKDGTGTIWSMYSVDFTSDPSAETEAIAACDRALGDPLLKPEYALRRFLLLRGKAVRQLALNQADAGATLDLADAVLQRLNGNALAPSLAMGNHLLRALGDYQQGRNEAARAELALVDKQRRYASGIVALTSAMWLGHEHGWAQIHAAMQARAPADPGRLVQLFWASFYFGDFAEALRLGPTISLALPHGRDESRIEGSGDPRDDATVRHAEYAGAMAYALAATGRSDAAAAAIADERAVVARWRAQPSAGGQKGKDAAPLDPARLDAAADLALGKLALWEAAIALRGRAGTLGVEDLGQAMKAQGIGQLPVALDLIGQLKPIAGDDALRKSLRDLIEARRDGEIARIAPFDFATLNQSLPRPGLWLGPPLKRAGDGMIFGDANGFYVTPETGSAYANVRYGNRFATDDAIDDLSLLAAATYARKAGKDSFLVDARLVVRHVVRLIREDRSTVGTGPQGSEVRLRILPVNAAELTPDLEPSRWRLIRADDVIAELGPLYARAD